MSASSNNNLLQTASDRHIRATLTALCRKDRKLEREALTMLSHLETFETRRLQQAASAAAGSNAAQPPQQRQATAGVKRKMPTTHDESGDSNMMETGAELCIECGSTFDAELNSSQACQFHKENARTEPDLKGDFWADHDEDLHGRIDSEELREEYPDGYLWTCCAETGSHPGCQRGPHKTRFDPVGRTGH
ncbi:hypothetical protein Micbo1qcDRAFT_197820 [Microdochium bolleyi]|uniref:Uncharacterized protein n=1 Tax=Microdochium bolleyi TaxID=196109 RepID=A0A136IRE5_9PEZI|nr:hypothetical protein Micbo1qcDRAFT_197820 [Microdochium bolleyi]